MPVIDGIFVPRTPLTPAELHVDFVAHDNHVVQQRLRVEAAALPLALRIVRRATLLGDVGRASDDLTARLARELVGTAEYGFREAQREIATLRAADPVAAAVNPPAQPAPGTLAQIARQGLDGIARYVNGRAAAVTSDVVRAVLSALQARSDTALAVKEARGRAQRALHNGVLDLVGSTLNLGRTSGAATLEFPPAFAYRSEQLDKNTCKPCDLLHGSIVQFGTALYFAKMPPLGCLGGGRCRGLYVFADGPRQMHMPEQLAA